MIDINSNGPSFFPYSNEINKCRGTVMTLMIHMQNYVFLVLLKT